MRRTIYAGDVSDAVATFRRAPYIHLAGLAPDGRPLIRVVHGVVVDDKLCFHAARAGEKLSMLGQPVVASAEDIVAEIPSYFFDPSLACPATTYYRSAQARGRLQSVEDLDAKAAIMQALMERFQPEAGHDPIGADDPRYRPMLKGLLVASLGLDTAVAKNKLGQNRRPSQLTAIVEQLWQRGAPRDPWAIEVLRAANPMAPDPPFLRGPDPVTLSCCPLEIDVDDAVALLEHQYWTRDLTRQQLVDAHRNATAWVGARDPEGRLVATARAISDTASYAYIADVAVHPDFRNRGVGTATVRLLLDHPQVRSTPRIHLQTKDAHPFYQRLGFTLSQPTAALLPLTRS